MSFEIQESLRDHSFLFIKWNEKRSEILHFFRANYPFEGYFPPLSYFFQLKNGLTSLILTTFCVIKERREGCPEPLGNTMCTNRPHAVQYTHIAHQTGVGQDVNNEMLLEFNALPTIQWNQMGPEKIPLIGRTKWQKKKTTEQKLKSMLSCSTHTNTLHRQQRLNG